MRGKRPAAKRQTTIGNPAVITNEPPESLNKFAAAIWRQTLDDITAAGRSIDVLDRSSFIGFCMAAGTAQECAEIIDREGITTDGGRDGLKKHPACSVRSTALHQMRLFAAELGLTAGSRARLPLPEIKKPSRFQQFLKDYPPTSDNLTK